MIFNVFVVLTVHYFSVATTQQPSDLTCNVRARVESGWVCGLLRETENGKKYASFRGIPYAEQPLGALRFQELQPVKPWRHHLNAKMEGPICPQHERYYNALLKPLSGMSEACIYVNVHVPWSVLPIIDRADDEFRDYNLTNTGHAACPIFLFIHGGGYQSGSGDSDLYGPEYLIDKGFIVITFNYRLNVFGFLSLNNAKIPGNAGLRDQVTLLNWVQRNARAFGGNPRDVTLAGHSAGGTSAHLLALSRQGQGAKLFKRVVLLSGTAITSYFTTSPAFASQAATQYLTLLGINSTDPDYIHNELTTMPLERIMNANSIFQDDMGLISFTPVIEGEYPGVTRIVDDEPLNLMRQGRGNEFPMIVGFTNNECEYFRRLIVYLRLLSQIEANPALLLAVGIQFTNPTIAIELGKKVMERYFHGKPNYDDYIRICSDTYFVYPAFQLVRRRAQMNAAPSFLYQFTYKTNYSVIMKAANVDYEPAVHLDDLIHYFRTNSILDDDDYFELQKRDLAMSDWLNTFLLNFMRCNDPTCGKAWPPVDENKLNYELVHEPGWYDHRTPTRDEWDMIRFHDKINEIGRGATNI